MVLRYLSGTRQFGLCLTNEKGTLTGWANADWAGDTTDRKSTTGFVLQIGLSTVLWGATKQLCVTLSSTEAENVSLS